MTAYIFSLSHICTNVCNVLVNIFSIQFMWYNMSVFCICPRFCTLFSSSNYRFVLILDEYISIRRIEIFNINLFLFVKINDSIILLLSISIVWPFSWRYKVSPCHFDCLVECDDDDSISFFTWIHFHMIRNRYLVVVSA